MADIFDTLLSDGESDPSALIAQLRRQNMLGQMAQLSGDRVLTPMGRQQTAGAQEMAGQLGNQRARRQLRQDELAYRNQQNQQAQQNADRSYQLQMTQAALGEQFRRDQLAQTASDREAQRDVSLANAREAADARRAASTQSTEKVARELRGDLQKSTSSGALVDEAEALLKSDAAPGTSLPTRLLRGTIEAMGGATEGTDSLAKLQSIGSLLVQAAPKLGGATSDKDVMMYQEASGKLQDPSVPNSAKLAALDVMKGVISRNKTYFEKELGALTEQKAARAPRGASGAWSAKEPTATGPNGQKLVLRNGQWQPL